MNSFPVYVDCRVCKTTFSKAPTSHLICCSPACSAQWRRDYERARSANRLRTRRVAYRSPAMKAVVIERHALRREKRDIERALAHNLQIDIDKEMRKKLSEGV